LGIVDFPLRDFTGSVFGRTLLAVPVLTNEANRARQIGTTELVIRFVVSRLKQIGRMFPLAGLPFASSWFVSAFGPGLRPVLSPVWLRAWFRAGKSRAAARTAASSASLSAIHLPDVDAEGHDHQPIGRGRIDFKMVRQFWQPHHLLVLELNPRATTAEVLESKRIEDLLE
jgi:hypothetical protein